MVKILKVSVMDILNRDDKVESLYGWATGDKNFKGKKGSDYRALVKNVNFIL